MGNCCFGQSPSYEDVTPDPETRRRQQMEAAERRLANQEHRGIKNIEAVRRLQQRTLERERLEDQAGNPNTQSNMRWQMN